jgi:hypothetical protein
LFSPIQKRIIDILGNKAMRMKDLSDKVYATADRKPMSPGTSVRTAIQYINYKCELNGLKWKIQGDGGMGRNGSIVKKVKCP